MRHFGAPCISLIQEGGPLIVKTISTPDVNNINKIEIFVNTTMQLYFNLFFR